jgi:hypothetical protein
MVPKIKTPSVYASEANYAWRSILRLELANPVINTNYAVKRGEVGHDNIS